MTSPLEQLGREVAERMGDGVTDERLDAQRQALMAHVVGEQRPRQRWVWGGLGIAAAACAVIVVMVLPARPVEQAAIAFNLDGQRLRFSSPVDLDAVAGEPIALAFGDGSEVRFAPGSKGRLSNLDGTQAVVRLSRGQLNGKVTPGTGRAWRFEAGPNLVHIVGTVFVVAWEPSSDHFLVEVSKGVVRVEGPELEGGQVTLRGGERLETGGAAPASSSGLAMDQQPAAAEIDLGPRIPVSPEVKKAPDPAESRRAKARRSRSRRREPRERRQARRSAEQARSVASASQSGDRREARRSQERSWTEGEDPAQTRWKNLARQGSFKESMAAADAAGLNRLLYQMSRAELSKFIEVARYARDSKKARQALKVMQRRFQSSREGKIASFLLGRVAFELEGKPKIAAKWFRTYLKAQPNGEFADQARGRLIDCLQRTGDRAGARRAAKKYLERFPHGAYAEAAKAILQDE